MSGLISKSGIYAKRILMRGDCERVTFIVGSVLCVFVIFTPRVFLEEVQH